MSNISPFSLFSLALVAVCILFAVRDRRLRKRLPPSPPGIPYFGNMFQLPPSAWHLKLYEWARQYGDIFSLRIGGKTIIVLNSPEVADDLLCKRARNYSTRPENHVAFDLLSDGQRMVLMSYGEQWKTARKGVASVIGPSSMKYINNLQELESRVLLYDLLQYKDKDAREFVPPKQDGFVDVPEDHWFYFIRRFTASIILNLTYAQRVHKLRDVPHVTKIFDILTNFLRILRPGQYLVDVFPILSIFPDFLAKWRVEGKRMHAWEMDLFGGLLEEHKASLESGTARDCFVSSYLRARAESGHESAPGRGITSDGWMRDKFLAYTAGSMLEAATDTSASTLQIFMLHMLSHPEALRKAREEIIKVVGDERMPTWEDEKQLPYLVACIKESMRLQPSATTSIPHAAEEDDEYKGYFIPKGSVIIGNVYTIQRDSVRYPDPHAYRPERFYTPGEPTRWGTGPETKDRDIFVFGWGRRYCQGMLLAQASLFMACSRIVWGLEVAAPKDPKTGEPMLTDADDLANWTNDAVNAPKIFPAVWKARNEKTEEIIRKSFEEAQHEWQLLGLEPDVR